MTNTNDSTPTRHRNRRAKITDVNGPDSFAVNFEFLNDKGESIGTWSADCTKLPGFHKSIVGTITGQLVVSRVHNKLMDSYADAVLVPDAKAAAQETFAELVAGNWSQRGEGGPRISILAEALAHLSNDKDKAAALGFEGTKTVEECQTAVDGLSKDQKAAIQKHPVVAAEMARLRASRATETAKEKAKAAKGIAIPKLF